MHQPIRDGLEDYLNGNTPSGEFREHLAACESCAARVRELERHSLWIQTLRHQAEIDPSAAFYARVLERIERRTGNSVWSVFLQPGFSRRIAYASMAMVLLLGTYIVTTEPGESVLVSSPVAAQMSYSSPRAMELSATDASTPQDRDAVLVNLVSYQDAQ